MKTVDIVVPCFNEEAMLSMFYTESEKIYKTIDGYDFTYIFVIYLDKLRKTLLRHFS